MSTRPSQNEEIGMTNQDPKEGMAPRAGFEPATQRSELRITKPLVALLHSVEARDLRAVDLVNHTIRRYDALAGMNVAYFFAS